MSDPPPQDKNKRPQATAGNGPLRLRNDTLGEHATTDVDEAVGSINAAAQESPKRPQVAATELHKQTQADSVAVPRTAREQHEHELERARLAIRSLMSHLETVQTKVLMSTERVRRTADNVARAIEDAAGEQLRALREQVEAAGAAVDLIATGVAAIGGEEERTDAAERTDVDNDAGMEPAAPAALAEDVTSSTAALLEQDEPTAGPDGPGDAQSQASDAERARLAAVNMALNGTPRDDTARHLADSFVLDDADATALLDDVYRLAEEAG